MRESNIANDMGNEKQFTKESTRAKNSTAMMSET